MQGSHRLESDESARDSRAWSALSHDPRVGRPVIPCSRGCAGSPQSVAVQEQRVGARVPPIEMTAGYVRVKDANDPLHDGPPRIRRVEILRNGTSRKVVTLDVASRTMQRVAIGASGKERRAPTDRLLVSVGGLGAAPPETTGTALQRQSPWRRSRSTRSGTTPRPRGPSRARRRRCRRSARERAVDGSEGGPPRVCVHGRGVRDRRDRGRHAPHAEPLRGSLRQWHGLRAGLDARPCRPHALRERPARAHHGAKQSPLTRSKRDPCKHAC